MGGSVIPRAPVRQVWLSPCRDRGALLAEVSQHAQRGFRIRVVRSAGGAFEVVQNGTCFMVRTLGGDAVGTWNNVAAALEAGDAHLDPPPPEDDPSDFLPRSA